MRAFFQSIQINAATKAYLTIVGAFWLGIYVGSGSASEEMADVVVFLMTIPPLFVIIAIAISAVGDVRRARKDKS